MPNTLKFLIKQYLQELKHESKDVFAACVFVRNPKNGMILSVSRKSDPNKLGLPGGKVDPGELPEIAAARELQEETGLIATNVFHIFTDVDVTGKIVSTYGGDITGKIYSEEEGRIAWVTPLDLVTRSPYSDYNLKLFKKLKIL